MFLMQTFEGVGRLIKRRFIFESTRVLMTLPIGVTITIGPYTQ